MRSLEAIWAVIGLIMAVLLVLDVVKNPSASFSQDRLVYVVGLGMAAMMFIFRRRQRQALDRHKNNGQAKP